MTEDLTPKTDTVALDITNIIDTPALMLKPQTKDRLQALLQIHSVNAFPSAYQMEKHQNM